jgi:PleD family two-component response regulator
MSTDPVRRRSGPVDGFELRRSGSFVAEPQTPRALILVASQGEWVARSLENVLESNGYSVLRVESGRRALELARRTKPDALLLDDSLPDISGVDVCRALRDDPLFNHATPVFLMATVQHASRVRSAAYEAGAWDYCTLPLDVETLLAKIGTYMRAAREIEDSRANALVDRLTGLYSPHGIDRLVEQLSARAVRKKEPIACLVLAPELVSDTGLTDPSTDLLAELTDVCRTSSRRSDVVGYLGDLRVAIVAPDTDAVGVQRLIDRLRLSLEQVNARARTGRSTSLRVGYYAVSNLAEANLVPAELVQRAKAALDHVPRGSLTMVAVNFDDVLLN